MSIFDSCLLGLLQGLTEFLPVSSSGHLVVAETLMQFKASELLLFDLILHLATLLAVCLYYRQRLFALSRACLPPYSPGDTSPEIMAHRKLIAAIGLSTFITVIIGLGFKDQFEQVRDNLTAVGGAFLITGVLLLATRWASPRTSDDGDDYPMNLWLFAAIVGFTQGVAILPGVSRSGATVCTALLLGLSRTRAVEYSFLLSIPAILMASVYESLFSDSPLGTISPFPASIGFLCSLISGILFLWLLVWIVRKGRLHLFAFYTIPLGILILAYRFFIR